MATFVLIHGSWHGAWCWDRLAPLLRKRGHRVTAIDLPAHGEDRTPLYRASLGGYSRRVRAAVADLEEKPIAVGHSMGGLAITQAAIDAPELFAALVYLCAFVPLAGESLVQLAGLDGESLISASTRYRPTSIRVRPDKARALFYNECSDADAAWATAQLRPDPWLPLIQKFAEPRHATLPRGYIECTKDRTISLPRQRAMAGRITFDRVVTLESDHSPFLSSPDELASRLHEMAQLAT